MVEGEADPVGQSSGLTVRHRSGPSRSPTEMTAAFRPRTAPPSAATVSPNGSEPSLASDPGGPGFVPGLQCQAAKVRSGALTTHRGLCLSPSSWSVLGGPDTP